MDSTITKFIVLQVCIWIPLLIGSYVSSEKPLIAQQLSRRLITVNLMSLEPIIVLWSIWNLHLNTEQLLLPAWGLFQVLIGFGVGVVISKMAHFQGKQKHTFIISSSLANHGFTMGGFLCYMLYGEKGLALSFIFITYFMPYVIIVIFSYARFFGAKTPFSIRQYFFTKQNMPLYALLLALILNAAGIQRPTIYLPLDYLIIASLIIYYFSVGIYCKWNAIFTYNTAHILLFIVKFIIVPLCVYGILSLTHLTQENKSIIQLQSFMPAALYSVIASILFNLDHQMATSMFLLNTILFTLAIMPLLIVIFH